MRDALGLGWDLSKLKRQRRLKIVFTTRDVLRQELQQADSVLLEEAAGDVLDDDKYLKKFMADNKNMLAATNQLKDTVSWVSFPGANGLQAEKVVVDARDEILKGTRPAKDILTEAVQKVNKLIAS